MPKASQDSVLGGERAVHPIGSRGDFKRHLHENGHVSVPS